MRIAPIALLVVAACSGSSSSTVPPPSGDSAAVVVPDGPGRVAEGSFRSEALGVDKRYLVYLPTGYDTLAARRYPVVYMLHGLGGNEHNWSVRGQIAKAADALRLQVLIVMPDGDASFYANAVTPADREACLRRPPTFSPKEPPEEYCVASSRYEDYVVRDLIAHVDATYRTIPERAARGIGGLSMGGFGALMLAMRHPDVFASAASHSGVDAILYAGPHPYVAGKAELADDVSQWGREVEPIGAHFRAIFGPDLANWKAHDPATLATKLDKGALALYLDCGTEDGFMLDDGAQYLHEVLTARGIEHEWYLGPGRHDFAFWTERIDDSLRFHAARLAAAR